MLPKLGLDSSRPAIRHLLLATSSLAESTLFETGVPVEQNLVYRSHYTKAIQQTASSSRVENVLMACLLFSCCEFLQGSIARGLGHIYSGIHIIHDWSISDKGSKEATIIIDSLTPIFLAYVDKAPTYGVGVGDRFPCNAQLANLVTPMVELPFVGRIDALHSAHFALDGISHHVARIADGRRAASASSSPHEIEMLLIDWLVEFEKFENSLPAIRRKRYSTSIQLLRISHTMLSIMMQASGGPNDESVYLDFEGQFAWIVGQFDCLALALAKDPSRKFITGRDDIEHHFGYIAPLFFTAIKCRNPHIRSAAMGHLRHLKVAENNWTSCTAYQIARKVVEIENRHRGSNLSISPQSESSETRPQSHEQDLIRPVEAFLSNRELTQATLIYTSYPDQSPKGLPTLLLQETVDLMPCPAASRGYWPLKSVLRIGGLQSGLTKPFPTGCECGDLPQTEDLSMLPLKIT